MNTNSLPMNTHATPAPKYCVTHLVAPARWASYLLTRDPSGLDSDEVLTCERQLNTMGEVVAYGPWTRGTRADPAMNEYTFVRAD